MTVTLQEINQFHADRGNTAWDDVEDQQAALLKAEDYVLTHYAPLIDDAEEDPLYLIGLATLALDLAQAKPSDDATPRVKKEAKEGVGFKKEVEYFDPLTSDPFPTTTSIFAKLRKGGSSNGVSFGRLVRR